MKRFKPIPRFKSEDEEREFWATQDSTEYFDWSKAQRVTFPNLKPSKELVVDPDLQAKKQQAKAKFAQTSQEISGAFSDLTEQEKEELIEEAIRWARQ